MTTGLWLCGSRLPSGGVCCVRQTRPAVWLPPCLQYESLTSPEHEAENLRAVKT